MGETIRCRDETGATVDVVLTAGTATRGIGYAGPVPVCVCGGVARPAPRPEGRAYWSDFHDGAGSGQQWTTIERGPQQFVWARMKGVDHGSGWRPL